MNTIRAQKIAEAFFSINSFAVDSIQHGIRIYYLGSHAYFDKEENFWVFAAKLAQLNHEERQVAEIEAVFTAPEAVGLMEL